MNPRVLVRLAIGFLFSIPIFSLRAARGPESDREAAGPPFPGTLTHIPSAAGGEIGIAVRVMPPPRPRYSEGAPVVIHVRGGFEAGTAAGRPELTRFGFVELYFAFPGGGRSSEASGGTYDLRGPHCIRALSDVIRFATGRIRDGQGRSLDDLVGGTEVLKENCGLIGSSQGGNACGVVMARHGREFPDLAWYVSMESPYGEGMANAELGGFGTELNPAYDPDTGVLDLSTLAFSPAISPNLFHGRNRKADRWRGALFFDLNRDGRFARENDFPAFALTGDAGTGLKAWYSPRLLREAKRRNLWGEHRPAYVPTVEQAMAFWRYRDAAPSIPEGVRNCPKVAVIVYAGERDHVQVAPDHPHIRIQVEGFRKAGVRFIRLNPDRAYVESVLPPGRPRGRPETLSFADNDAGVVWTRRNIRQGLEPRGPPPQLFIQASACELADRTQGRRWDKNLDAVLRRFEAGPPAFPPGPGRRFEGPGGSRPRDRFRPRSQGPPRRRRATQGPRELRVDCGNVIGEIRSLLGVNRGPYSLSRRAHSPPVSLVESYHRLGIDFIRTHDFYGPTDWYVIFPDWAADPEGEASYDFSTSDPKISAIITQGFRCFYRLGTSWKGRRRDPINDPPGTIRNASGGIVHVADRDDFRKWARICVQTARHYTEGWNNGFHYPIEYWEIWNEPDLAAQFWTGTPEQYAQLYGEAARALKRFNPKFKVGGPACTGGLREAYVEGFIRYCAEHKIPLDFFSWHSYGGRGQFNPHDFYRDARRIRVALDKNGFTETENIVTEWNAGIQRRLFSETPQGAAFYASVLANLLDAGVDHAFQYCGDQHPGLGLHETRTGEPKICADAFVAWKHLLETPLRVQADGSDASGYNIIAGKSADGRRVRILISDFQSDHDSFELRVSHLPWGDDTPFTMQRWLVDATHRLAPVEEFHRTGRQLDLARPFRSGSFCLIELFR